MEQNKPTPPIPPNCPHFEVMTWPDAGKVLYFVGMERKFIVSIEGGKIAFNQHQRAIVAAVARCAWLDERSQRNERWRNTPIGHPGATTAAITEAERNAEAWRVWGISK